MARILTIDPDNTPVDVVEAAAKILREGGLVAIPTETVYGLAADAGNSEALGGIYRAKGRPSHNPLILHAADPAMARSCVAAWPDDAEALAAQFWPGPLTIVLPRAAWVPDAATGGRDTVGVRIPAVQVVRDLAAAVGRPLAAPSANRSNAVSTTRAEHVAADLGDAVDLILDGGPCTVGIESTVLDLTGEDPTILRPGPIGPAEIEAVLGRPVRSASGGSTDTTSPASPGMLPIHYAPSTPAFRIEAEEAGRIRPHPSSAVLILGSEFPSEIVASFAKAVILDNPSEAGRRIYDVLRQLDQGGFASLYVAMPPQAPEWAAIRDRMTRATRTWCILPG